MQPAVPHPDVPAAGPARRLPPLTPRVALTLAAAALLAAVLLAAFGAVKPFVLGVVFVYLLAPLVDGLARARIPRVLAVLIVFAGVIAAIAVVAAMALAPLVQQVRLFVDDLPAILTSVRQAVLDFYAGLNLAPEIREVADQLLADAAGGLRTIDLGAIVAPLVGSLVGLLGAITAYAILPAWLFFLLKDRLRLAGALERSLPATWRGDVFAVAAIANRVFGNWVRGQLLLGTVVGVASYIGLMALSQWVDPVFGRYAVLLAIVAGLLELIPFIGPIIAAIPAVLIGLTVGPDGFLAALALYAGIQQLENNLLVPKIQGDAVELHPSAVMVALIVGASLGGILGAIVSLPIAAASRDVFRYLFNRVGDPPASIDASLARISPALVRSVRRSAVAGPGVPGAGVAGAPAPGLDGGDASAIAPAGERPATADRGGPPGASAPGGPSAGPGAPDRDAGDAGAIA